MPPTRLLLRIVSFACVGWSWSVEATTAEEQRHPPASIAPETTANVDVIPISDGFAGSSVNVIAGLQNSLFTHGRSQFAAFYAPDGEVVVARREVPAKTWHCTRTSLRGNVSDAHNTIALIVDGAGYLHLAWNHHGDPLNYVRSRRAQAPDFGAKSPMVGSREERVTYPQFLRLPDGDLLFFYRDGRSGRGNLVLNRYSVATATWSRVHDNLIDGEGRRSAYPSVAVDARGSLHLAWNWRESPDVASNHDLAYARSDDGGRTWQTVAGKPLTVPLTEASADYALRLPQNRTLMNPPAVGTDFSGRPVVANYWIPEGSSVPQYQIVRWTGSTWKVEQVSRRTSAFVLAGASTKRPPLSRCVLFQSGRGSAGGRLHLVYRDDEQGGRILLATSPVEAAADAVWELQTLTDYSVGAWEPSLDPTQAQQGRLHLLVQRVEQADGNDQTAEKVPPTTVSVLTWTP